MMAPMEFIVYAKIKLENNIIKLENKTSYGFYAVTSPYPIVVIVIVAQ